ncbi:hypothetical protein BLNAU_5832 [Blattamonas nauphoetae]|uniref:Uncharacterized protein n=1 Tax=Blattamonas nauphoetae TaxID=2049346 RepID=A0ABQ9Y6J1_9EUKA|nr:hypothetical protein BLNAU_5832 [Blattamonas nauphoetae]
MRCGRCFGQGRRLEKAEGVEQEEREGVEGKNEDEWGDIEAFLTTQKDRPDEKTLKKLSNNLITQLGRRERDVQVSTLKCIIQLLRTAKPNMPLTKDQLKVMFRALLSAFELLENDKEVLYRNAFGLLEQCDELRLFGYAQSLDDPGLLDNIYAGLITILRPCNTVGIEQYVVRIISALIESADDIYPSQFNILFDYVIPNKKKYADIHRKAACEVFRSAAESLQRPLSEYFKQILFDPIIAFDKEIRTSQSHSPSLQAKHSEKQPKPKAKRVSKTLPNTVANKKYLVVIETLHIHAPRCLFLTYPLLTNMLQNVNIAVRRTFVSLVAQMMKGNATAVIAHAGGLLEEWKKRFTDESKVIREQLCASTMQIGHSYPTVIPQFMGLLLCHSHFLRAFNWPPGRRGQCRSSGSYSLHRFILHRFVLLQTVHSQYVQRLVSPPPRQRRSRQADNFCLALLHLPSRFQRRRI